MSDQKPSDKRSLNLEPLNHFMKQMDRLFTDQSGKGLLQNLDDFFIHSKPFFTRLKYFLHFFQKEMKPFRKENWLLFLQI